MDNNNLNNEIINWNRLFDIVSSNLLSAGIANVASLYLILFNIFKGYYLAVICAIHGLTSAYIIYLFLVSLYIKIDKNYRKNGEVVMLIYMGLLFVLMLGLSSGLYIFKRVGGF